MGRLPPTIRLVGLGWYIALSIALPVVGGVLLDDQLGTRPLLSVLGVVLGMVLAFWGAYRMVAEATKRDREGP
ncbi:MAG: AtpZ/AtpI family protein [Dehalococcoidia bacterium]|jgi:F0F1-type ATP synthase assembly protein I|nr:AtpZ/AtpI family protein [Dehalococcoidia bacterium]